MTRILLISPSRELLIQDIPIVDKDDVKKVKDIIEKKELEYGGIERILMTRGIIRLMEKGDEIPIPSDGEEMKKTSSVDIEIFQQPDRQPRTDEELRKAAKELWDQRIKEDQHNHD